ncbi:hypothetical protein J2Z48_002985 [Croceifilum oryzae]|uniref:Uncharacterized protein n=1 Tax=Croceifilum oryzae TaxID=1553429 RepID=A0AAJ1WV92_9BACL|nr:hypothetical protein [Croceifilum oryzae]MDQ0418781.1 hypothetical protein [Croceifilum oryzae]
MIRQDEINITLSKKDIYILLDELDNSYAADEELLEGKEELLGSNENGTDYMEFLQGEIEEFKDRMSENRRVTKAIKQEMVS